MNKYKVKFSFKKTITNTVEANSEKEAIKKVYGSISGLRSLGILFSDLDVKCRMVSWRDNEDYASILGVWGEPSFEHMNMPIWILGEDKGLILTYGNLVGFQVDKKDQIFDVWDDGHWVDYGPNLYKAYFDYVSEKELLR